MPEQSFSFSFNLSTEPQSSTAISERVIARPFDAFAVTPSVVLVRVAHCENALRLSNVDAMVLQHCGRLRPLSGHADELSRHHGAAFRTRALESLENLRKQGLLASERDLAEEFGQPGTPSQRPAMQTLYIRSSGRPRALARALASIVEGRCAEAGITRCVIIDDTPDSNLRKQIDALIVEVARHTALRLVHFGANHRRRLIDVLSQRAGIGRQNLDWFLRGQPDRRQRYGCGINVGILLSAGRRFGLLDDDASLQAIFGSHEADPGELRICSSNDYRAAFPHPGPVAPPFHEQSGFNPVRAHESWLGRTLGEVVSARGPRPARFADPTPATLADSRAEGRIRFTVNGVFGDPGTRSPRWLFCQPFEQLGEWMHGEARYRAALERRWTTRCEPDLRAVVDYSLMTTTLTGIDNSTLMLPTLPHGAGEDSLLGELVRFMDPGSLQLGMPWMLEHHPEQPRRWSAEDVLRPPALNAGLFFTDVLRHLSGTVRATGHPMRAGLLKQTLNDLSHACDRDLRSELARQVLSTRSAISMQLAQRRTEAALPDYLQRDYNQLIDAMSESSDLDRAHLAEAAGVIRDIAGRYATGIEDWISAWNSAREIGEEDLVDQITQP